jgi:hypothetical protein
MAERVGAPGHTHAGTQPSISHGVFYYQLDGDDRVTLAITVFLVPVAWNTGQWAWFWGPLVGGEGIVLSLIGVLAWRLIARYAAFTQNRRRAEILLDALLQADDTLAPPTILQPAPIEDLPAVPERIVPIQRSEMPNGGA